jgi:EF hand
MREIRHTIINLSEFRMKKLALISAAAIAVLASPAIAQDQMPTTEQIMGFLDANKDGFIDKTEAKGQMADYFDFIDADKDAKVSPAELQTASDAPAAQPAAK